MLTLTGEFVKDIVLIGAGLVLATRSQERSVASASAAMTGVGQVPNGVSVAAVAVAAEKSHLGQDDAVTAHNGRVDRPPLARRERILVAETDRDGVSVVATTVAIYRRDTPPAWTRLGWEQILSVRWDSAVGVLDLRGMSSDAPDVRLAPVRRSAIVALVRERVAATVLASTRVALSGHGDVLVTGRRRPGTADTFWVVVFSGAVDLADPRVHETVTDAIRELRRCAGAPTA